MLPIRKIKTRITDLFGIKFPIVQGGMIWTSGWKLAVAVSKAGGLGLIGAGSMTPELLQEHIRKAKRVWDGPLGVNIPLMRGDVEELIRVTIETGIKTVFSSAGNPGKYTELLHENGIIVTHVVPSLKLGLKAEARGVDAIVGEGTEAGGHNGFEEIPTFPLIQRLADHIKIPIIAAGGIRDGRGLAASIALGADGAQVGTRFACSVESSTSEEYKKAIVNSTEPATSLVLRRLVPTRILNGAVASELKKIEAAGVEVAELDKARGVGRARKGLFLGDFEEGYMEAGEIAGDIASILSADEIVQDIVIGYCKTIGSFPLPLE